MREQGREQVTLQVVHVQHRLAEGVAQRVADARADQKRPGQARAGRDRDGVNIGEGPPGVCQDRVQQRQDPPYMVPRGQFRHHPSIGHVHVDLRVQGVGQQAGLAVEQGEPGLVAGGLDAQDQHPASLRERPGAAAGPVGA